MYYQLPSSPFQGQSCNSVVVNFIAFLSQRSGMERLTLSSSVSTDRDVRSAAKLTSI